MIGARHHHGSDTPTSARAILHHTDQKGPNIMHPSVVTKKKYTDDFFIILCSCVIKDLKINE